MRPQVSNTPCGETMSRVSLSWASSIISASGSIPLTKQMPGTSMSSATRSICTLARLLTSSVLSDASLSRSLTRSPAYTLATAVPPGLPGVTTSAPMLAARSSSFMFDLASRDSSFLTIGSMSPSPLAGGSSRPPRRAK